MEYSDWESQHPIAKEFLVDPELRATRIEICKLCDNLTMLKTCSICSCVMPIKTWIKNVQCPVEKW
jgi:recombinational DNA repair protein RecR